MQTEAIKAAQDEVAKVKAQLESTIDSKFDAAKKELAATINELTEKVTKLTGLTTEMITSLDLQTANPELELNYAQLPAKLNPNTSVKDANHTNSVKDLLAASQSMPMRFTQLRLVS